MINRRLFLAAACSAAMCGMAKAGPDTAHAYSFVDIDGGVIDLAQFRGRPLMIVNTASRCGFTYQYDGLQALYDRYRERGFVVLTVPSDDFGRQELESETAVKAFCAVNFKLDLPMTSITRVRGRDAHPFYKWARGQLGPANAPRWNFHKYLVDGNGALVEAFSSQIEPESAAVLTTVETLLQNAGA
ncbi:MAG: glutathione peroxidase [Pseudomonadota bacterium]